MLQPLCEADEVGAGIGHGCLWKVAGADVGQGPRVLCWAALADWLVCLDHALAHTMKMKWRIRKMALASVFKLRVTAVFCLFGRRSRVIK